LRLEFFPNPLLAGLGMLVILLILLRRKRSPSYLVCFAVFWLYLMFVVSQTIFPIPLLDRMQTRSSLIYILSRVNLLPFNYGQLFDPPFSYAKLYEYPLNVISQEIIGNILLTMPFGFGLPFLARFKPGSFPWLAVGAGLAIEMTQLGFCLLVGADYRTVDITDVLLNAAGALLGYTLFRGFALVFVAISNRIKLKQSGLFAYVYEVAINTTF
jgi:glycopeptide antibiotics resistance protein